MAMACHGDLAERAGASEGFAACPTRQAAIKHLGSIAAAQDKNAWAKNDWEDSQDKQDDRVVAHGLSHPSHGQDCNWFGILGLVSGEPESHSAELHSAGFVCVSVCRTEDWSKDDSSSGGNGLF